MNKRYLITGMTCDNCVKHVTEEVLEIPGVDEVSLALDDAILTVSSQEHITIDQVEAAVSEAGDYQVSALEG